MPSTSGTKINRLLQNWPQGTVATQTWLDVQGVSSKLANWHVGSGWLTRFGPRAFLQPGDEADWRGGLYALQSQLKMSVHVGARTALELQGLAHFVPLGGRQNIIFISDAPERLPTWFKHHPWKAAIEHHALTLFDSIPDAATTQLDCGGFSIAISSPERAIIEAMRLANTNAEIEYAIQLMENLSTLRPNLVQQLLERCTAIKVKRLFLWSAERVGHGWVEGLDTTQVELGSGKRQLYKGGRFDPKYQITVPRLEKLPGV